MNFFIPLWFILFLKVVGISVIVILAILGVIAVIALCKWKVRF